MLIGAGGYGIGVLKDNRVTKYFYEIDECDKLKYEAEIQSKARQVFLDNDVNIKVPEIYNVYTRKEKINFSYKNNKNIDKNVLCGIEMEYITPLKCLEHIDSQIHLALGYNGDDIDTEWLVGETNYPRGFYMSAELLEIILEEKESKLIINDIASTMGKGIGLLLDNNIIPNDVEWIIDDNLDIWMIDFGLCYEGKISKEKYLYKTGSEGLGNDIYVPKNNKMFLDSYLN